MFQISLPQDITILQATNFLASLRSNPLVKYATFESAPTPPAADIPPVTPMFQPQQGYLNSSTASNGIDALYAWTISSGRGDGIKLIDVEYSWQTDHEDFPPLAFSRTFSDSPFNDGQHGAAALGIASAMQNNYGVTGIAPNAQVGISGDRYGTFATRVDAISVATQQLNPGDILLLEMQQYTDSNISAACGCSAPACLVPIDTSEAIFTAVQVAVAKGIVVVESAGNGGHDLDAACFAGQFDRRFRDSGAIVVGAGDSVSRAPLGFSCYGTRVDVQGWGNNVTTLGYGDLARVNGTGDARQFYTDVFGGTSSSTPMVAAASAVVQGVVKNLTGKYIDSAGMREHLRASGVAQPVNAVRKIGPLPNLRAAVDGVRGILDIDRDGQYRATTDGLLFLRYVLGLRDQSLVNGAVSTTATRPANEIENYLAGIVTHNDVDGDGAVLPSTDALLIVRYLMGYRGTQLTDTLIGATATRTTPAAIADFMMLRTPALR
jgi:serine protease